MASTLTQHRTTARTRFVIHQNRQGYWVASEKGGRVTGVFAIQRDALRFALHRFRPRTAAQGSAQQALR